MYMKKRLIEFMVAVTLPALLFAQEPDGISLDYSIQDFHIEERADTVIIKLPEKESHYLEDPTQPALPYMEYNFIIDANARYVSHRSTSQDVVIKSGVVVLPNTLPVPTSYIADSNPAPKTDVRINYANASYPSEKVVYLGSHLFKNTKVLSFAVSPFTYDAANRKLLFSSSIKLSIEIEDGGRLKKLSAETPRDLLRQLSDVSFNERDKIYKNRLKGAKSNEAPNIEYLVITCDSFKNEYQRLADWKTLKGVPAKVITTENIYATMEGKNHQQKIKNAIKQYFIQSNNLLQYVLLGGDVEIVPTQKCHVTTYSVVRYVADLASDMYYSSLKQIEWDTNGDGLAGEVKDGIDIAHDLIVTRLSSNSISDCHTQISRILKYEQQPDTIGWEDNILMGGNTIRDKHYSYAEGKMSDTQYKSEYILYKKYIESSWPNSIKYMFYDTGTSFAENDQYQFRTYNMLEQLRKGYTFINVVTHGNPDGWKMEWCADSINKKQYFKVNDVPLYENSGNTMIVTTACHTNAFDSLSTCLSEAFMRHEKGGILAYYGSTHYGWSKPDSTKEGASAMFCGLFYRTLLQSPDHQIGRSIYDSKALKIGYSNTDDTNRWLLLSMNGLCDPEMSLYISKPKNFNNIEINLNNGSAMVETGEADCKICVSVASGSEDSYYQVFNATDNTSFNVTDNDVYTVCVTKAGYVPYIAKVSNSIVIQNTNIESDTYFCTESAKIGHDVSNEIPFGNVNIKNCKVKIHSKGTTVIPNGFKVFKNSQLRIN